LHHFVARTIDHRPLFRSWEEGCHLWNLMLRHCPSPRALCVMPDHVHLLHTADAARGFHLARRAYAQWLLHRQADSRLWHRAPPPKFVPAGQKLNRDIRYIHLNPCRAHLVDDPLAWPLSTHLDAVGLAVPPCRPAMSDSAGFHAYVSGDPTVAVAGSELPIPALSPSLDDLRNAVSAATRTPTSTLLARRGPARSLFLTAARAVTNRKVAEIADYAGVSARAVRTIPRQRTRATDRIARMAGDPRIRGLHPKYLPGSYTRDDA
jgi:hypothetical protein